MSLIQLLQEASSLDLTDLKKAMQKDKNAALIFKKELKLEDIENIDSFLSTIKFFVLNNDNVKRFIESRNNIRDVDVATFMGYRKLKASDLDQDRLDWFREFVQNIFKEFSYVEKSGMSRDLKKLLNDWFNTSGKYYNLPTWASRELNSLPGIKPEKRMVLYRGLLFSEDSLKERKKYDGTLEIGNGLQFLKSIRDNKRTVDLEWDRPSSWSKSKEVATRFAQYGPASSHYGAMLQWFDRGISKRAIDGALGYVVAVYANPEDVLIDTEKFSSNFHMQHGNESEVILKPGKYLTRIIKKYTVAGEVDPEDFTAVDTSNIAVAYEQLMQLKENLKLNEDLLSLSDNMYWRTNGIELIKKWDSFKKLVLNSTTTEVLHTYDKIINAYSKIFGNITEEDLRADKYADDDEFRKKAEQLKNVYSWYNESTKSSKFENTSKKVGPRWKLSAEEFRKTLKVYDVDALEKPLLVGRKMDREAGQAIYYLAFYLDVKIPLSAKPHMFGAEKQAKMIDDVIDAFLKKLNISKSEDRMENVRTLINLLKKTARNEKMISIIINFNKLISELE